ncbi:MAG: hypothetical protein V1716_01810 [Candidatus Uhrbacteria bacterium]
MMMNKNLPAWFFTNEALVNFLPAWTGRAEIKKIYGIAGSGDFVFNFLAELNQVEMTILVDIRPLSCLTVKTKIDLFKQFSFAEINKLLADKAWQKSLKKTKQWYPDSFKPLSRKDEYLSYLTSEEKFENLKKQFAKIKIVEGDFLEQLRTFDNDFFDLIYASDIFDHKNYCPCNEENLKLVRSKMSERGSLLVVTQNQPREMIKVFEANGFRPKVSEAHCFNIFKAFWRYDYSFLLLEKI